MPWLDVVDLYEEERWGDENEDDILSFHEEETLSFKDVDKAVSKSFSRTIRSLPFLPNIGRPDLSGPLPSANEGGDLPLGSFLDFDIPMNPATTFPSECDNEVGGVLTILLDPAVVEANVEDIEDDDDDVEGDVPLR